MTITEAAEMLIVPGEKLEGNTWADLGCGSGTFTLALASLLPQGSTIYAIDELRESLDRIPPTYAGVTINKKLANFVSDPFPFNEADGILMANALHYVKDKKVFITKLKAHLKTTGAMIIIEYDTDKPVARWVPYPSSFLTVERMFLEANFSSVTKLHSRQSAFGGKMYSAIIRS